MSGDGGQAPETRADRLAALLRTRALDALVVTGLVNVRYLTGFTGSNGLAVVGVDGARRFVTDFRYETQAEQEVAGFERVIGARDLLGSVADALPDGEVRLGYEDGALSVRQRERLRSVLPDRVTLLPAGDLVEELRLVKAPDEVERIRAAARLADRALEAVLADGLVGRTERDVALALEHEMRRLGAQRPSFDTIVAHGAHGALPHATPRDVPIAAGTLVVIDWGAELDGYCSDCTRTYAAGEPTARAREVYEIVAAAQQAGLDAVRAGVAAADADRAARDVIAAAGFGDRFGHSLGHGVGLEVHEGPRLAGRSRATLTAGHVVTVEPGIYLPGELGVRIEDLVVVGDAGCEILSSHPKALTVVD